MLARILYWTGGHPYLTQRLCQAVAEANRDADQAIQVGTPLAVEYMGERYPVTVAVAGSTPLFDPDNSRMKA